tara:strand:+ start:580 stop:999 length:420 start_codon:yes stop_codon:yes gene_type:complete
MGEHLAAFAIINLGWRCVQCPQDGIDLLAFDGNIFMRVQVKSAQLRAQKDRHTPSYHHQLGSGRQKKTRPDPEVFDILARVALDCRRVFFTPAVQMSKLSERRSPEFFATPNLEADSWRHSVQTVLESRRDGLVPICEF